MRANVLILLVVASASANFAWKDGNIYNYKVVGRSFVALKQVSSENTGLVYHADLSIQHTRSVLNEDVLLANIEDAEYTEVQGNLSPDWQQQDFTEFGPFQPLPLTKQPFQIILKNGIVRDVQVYGGMPEWEVDLIRSIVSQFQINTQPESVIPSQLNSLPKGEEINAVYKVMEETIDGVCEVIYDISRMPAERQVEAHALYQSVSKDWIEIVKTKNYSNCENRPVFHFGFPRSLQWEPATNQMGNFLSRSAYSKIIVSGNLKSYTIHSSATVSNIILSPEIYNNQKGEVASQITVSLKSIAPVSHNSFDGPTNPKNINSLVSHYRSSKAVEELKERRNEDFSPFSREKKENNMESSTRYLENLHENEAKMGNPINPFAVYSAERAPIFTRQLAKKIADEAVQPHLVSKHISHELFAMLTENVRALNYRQLREISKELYTTDRNGKTFAAWVAFRDAVAQGGTNPTLIVITNWIEEKQIQGEMAAQIIATQANAVQVPSTAYIKAFFALVKMQEVVQDLHLNTAASFAFTNLVRIAQVDSISAHTRYPVHMYAWLAFKDNITVQEEYVPYYSQQLRQAVEEQNSQKIQLYIRVLGNIAHPAVMRVFEPYLEGADNLTTFQRTLVVVSLNKISKVYPNLARSVLYKLYINQNEPYQVRVAAVYNLMKTNPPAVMLQRMAQAAHHERNNQVRSAIKSAIESAASLVGDWNEDRRQNALAAVNMLPGEVQGVQYSRSTLRAYIVEGLNLAAEQHFSYIGSQDALEPQAIFYKLAESYNGLYNTGFRFGAMVSSTHDLTDFIFENENNHEQEQRRTKEDEFSFEKIHEVLKTTFNNRKELEGNLLFNFAAVQRYLTYSNSSELISPQNMARLLAAVTEGEHFSYQKRFIEHETVLAFPTILGFPFMYQFSKPTLMSVTGRVQVEVKRSSQLNKITIQPDIDFVYSSQNQARFQIITPFNRNFIAGYDRNVQISLPVAAKVEIDLSGSSAKAEIENLWNNDARKIFHYSTVPFTARWNPQELKTISENSKTIHLRSPHRIAHSYGEDTVGIVFKVKGSTEKKDLSFKTMYDQTVRHNFASLFAFPYGESTMEATSFDIFYDAPRATAKSIVFTASYDQHESKPEESKEQDIPKNHDMSRSERQSKFLSKVKIPEANSHVLDFDWKINGPKPSSFIVTLAASKSQNHDHSKAFVFVQSALHQQKVYELNFEASSDMPSVSIYNFPDALKNNEKGEIKAKLSYGEGSKQGSVVYAQALFDKTESRLKHVKQMPQAIQCEREMNKQNHFFYGCRNATYHAGLFDKCHVVINYQSITEYVKDQTYQLYSVLRHLGFPYMSEDIYFQQKNDSQVQLDFQYAPDLTRLNVTVGAPIGMAQFQNIPVSKVARSLAVIHPIYSVIQRVGFCSTRQKFEPTCSVDASSVQTFDNMTYPLSLSKDWHVVAVSTRNNQREVPMNSFLIAVREVAEDRRELLAEFYDLDIKLNILPDTIIVDGNVKELSKGKLIVRKKGMVAMELTRLKEGAIIIWIPEYKLELVYESNRLRLTVNPSVMSHIQGLCGNLDGEVSDRITPQKGYLQNNDEFIASWALTSSVSQFIQKRTAKKSIFSLNPYHSNIVSDQDAGRVNSTSGFSNKFQKKSGLPLNKKLMVIEHDGKLCFSVEPQPACKNGKIVETQPKLVSFVCVEKTTNSLHWAMLVNHGFQPDFSRKGNAQKIEAQVPAACSQ